MKILHVPFTFYPDPCGGTEIYVATLCRQLDALGAENIIAAPGERSAQYDWAGTKVWRFATTEVTKLGELYDRGDVRAAEEFDRILEISKPDIVHFHAHTRAASILCVECCHKRGIPVIYTYHTPTATCQRGTMMRYGVTPCDGRMETSKCGSCTLHGLGLSKFSANVMVSMGFVGSVSKRLGLQGGIWTALRMRESTNAYQRKNREFLQKADHIIAVCDWVRQVIHLNGIESDKVTLCRQGIDWKRADSGSYARRGKEENNTLRLAYLGRMDPAKGLKFFFEVLRAAPNLPVTLDAFCIYQDGDKSPQAQELLAMAQVDPRINLLEPIASEDVVSTLRRYDLLVVPSLGLETGPLVVLEAYAAGIPVIGSNIGGIAELVKYGESGILCTPNDVKEWSVKLKTLCEEDGIKRLRVGIPIPRHIDEVAAEMKTIYTQLRFPPPRVSWI